MRGTEKACLSLLGDPMSGIDPGAFLRIAEWWLQSMDHSPTHAAVKAPTLSGKPMAYTRIQRKLQQAPIVDSEYVTLMVMPPNDQCFAEPAVSASFRASGEVLLAVDTAVRVMDSSGWCEIARRLHAVFPFQYGYNYLMRYEWGPWQYAAGFVAQTGVGGARHEEELRTRWMHVRLSPNRNPRGQRIRQVYRLQFLSEGHLQLDINGTTLRQWILGAAERGRLSLLVNGVWTWTIETDEQTLAANQTLFAAGLLSAWDPGLAGAITT